MKFKTFLGLSLLIMPLSVIAVDDDLLVYKANKDSIYSKFYGENDVNSVYLREGYVRFSATIDNIYYDCENDPERLVMNVLVSSKDNSFLYSNNFNVKVLLADIDIDWVRGTFGLSTAYIVNVMPISSFQLRSDIDQKVADSIVTPLVHRVLDKKRFKIPRESLRSMSENAKYYIKSKEGNIYISL